MRILPTSPFGATDLKEADRLISVNDTEVCFYEAKAIMELMRECEGNVTLHVARDVRLVEVSIKKDRFAKTGLKLKKLTFDENSLIEVKKNKFGPISKFVVTGISPTSPFHGKAAIKEGDEIDSINDKAASSFASVAEMSKRILETGGRLNIVLKKTNPPPPIAAPPTTTPKEPVKVAAYYLFSPEGGLENPKDKVIKEAAKEQKKHSVTFTPLETEYRYSPARNIVQDALSSDKVMSILNAQVPNPRANKVTSMSNSMESLWWNKYPHVAQKMNSEVLPDVNRRLQEHHFKAGAARVFLQKSPDNQTASHAAGFSSFLSDMAHFASNFDPTGIALAVGNTSALASHGAAHAARRQSEQAAANQRPALLVVVEPLPTLKISDAETLAMKKKELAAKSFQNSPAYKIMMERKQKQQQEQQQKQST